jgi:AcrR family transcriptional regulator
VKRKASAVRRRQILAAALDCFLRQGFEATTVEHIRDSSGASHGSIYHHFGSKEAIALALYEEGMQAYQQTVLEQLHRQNTAEQGVRALVTAHLRWTAADPNYSLYLTRVGTANASENTAERITAVNREFPRAVYDWLTPFIDRGEILRLPPELYVPLILGPAAHLARHWLLGRVEGDLVGQADVLADMAWRALRPGE